MEVWPISQSEAARRVGVSPTVAGLLVKSHKIPVIRMAGGAKFIGLSRRAFQRFAKAAAPLANRPRIEVAEVVEV